MSALRSAKDALSQSERDFRSRSRDREAGKGMIRSSQGCSRRNYADLVRRARRAAHDAEAFLSAVLVRLPSAGQRRARSIARRSTSASKARSGIESAISPAAAIAGSDCLVGVEMFGQDGPPARGDDSPGQRVFQLPDVAGPGTLLDRQQGLGRQGELAPAVRLLDTLQDMVRQGLDIFSPVAERRDHDPCDIQAVIEVFAKPAGRDLSGQVAMGRRNQPGVGTQRFGTADALELTLLNDAEDLDLGRRGAARRPRQERSCRRRLGRTGRASGGRRR